MDIFHLRQHVIDKYADYTRSFLTIFDPDIRAYVDRELNQGRLWPDALVQLSPAYDRSQTIADLVQGGVLHPRCADIFQVPDRDGQLRSVSLYRHQRQAIDLAAARKHFVVTTGTGSGKSLTYIVPIFDHVLRNNPAAGRVRAIIVYPMNALINSQEKAIERFLDNGRDVPCPVRFARYTGQESEAQKREIQQNPPHILLTNYIMLELMLTRPDESPLVDARATDVQFVVLDELHTYRGRQGADVALLMRRLRERCGNAHLLCIGTSATMVSGDSANDRRAAVAAVAGRVFGVELPPDQVIEETLTYAVSAFNPPSVADLRAALRAPLPAALDWPAFQRHPLAHWIEQTYSLREDSSGMLRRAEPQTLRQGAELLAGQTGVAVEQCLSQLRDFFQLGARVRDPEGNPGFAFKLHQFFSQGSAVYSTLEPPDRRHLTLEGQRFVQGPDGERLLFPLVFCRECGQHYALCAYDPQQQCVTPRQPFSHDEEVVEPARPGYLLLDGALWSEELEETLPDAWFRQNRRGRTIKPEFREYVPQRLEVQADGQVQSVPSAQSITAWFLPMPFLACLRCGAVYTRREDDFRKLARLSSEGRSTATTLLSLAAISEMRRLDLDPEAQKLLSFTDNRQDASLQAGHFNDFVNVVLLRSAIARAINQPARTAPLTHLDIAHAVFEALALPEDSYAKEPGRHGNASRNNARALEAYLEYRIYEDLRRSWRVTQPNLEQCGLLRIDYAGLHELCDDPAPWQAHALLAACAPADRERTIRALLDHMRRDLAIDVPCIDPDRHPELVRRVNRALKPEWSFGEDETAAIASLRSATRFLLVSDGRSDEQARSLSIRTRPGRFLRSSQAWPVLSAPLDEDAYLQLLGVLCDILQGAGLLIDVGQRGSRAVQVRSDALLWCPGDGAPPPFDPIRARQIEGRQVVDRQANAFFRAFYLQPPAGLHTIEGCEHTGQVAQDDREEREQRFRAGQLPVLFCSPTMELGIDIRDLNVVHMRNVPPTPANYAQRSGRAGRSGQPALVMTYCSTGSGHDQYFFQRREAMVAGVVAAPQIDLANEDLVRAHVQAIWLAFTGLDLKRSMLDLIDMDQPALPLKPEVLEQITLDAPRQTDCLELCWRVLARAGLTPERAGWFSQDWLAKVVAEAPREFDQACERWRDLYRAADQQLQAARAAIDGFHRGATDRREREEAERQESEARRQKDLLINQTTRGGSEGDFYTYRYFASEGFLPGYNFPRLPVRAFVPTDHKNGVFLSRPRFLAITEFGPQNIIYHEGRKYRVVRSLLPAGDANQRFLRAKICRNCGYFHPGTSAEICEQCGTLLQGHAVEYLPSLFEMTTVLTTRVERITCEEEERLREGFEVNTFYQFASEQQRLRRQEATVTVAGGIGLTYAPTATLWRVNHGWRRSRERGFTLDLRTGRWGKRKDDPLSAGNDLTGEALRSAVQLVVRDTRNLLIVQLPQAIARSPAQVASLQYALQRGIATVFQLEEQELSSQRPGQDAATRLLFWEAAEGGAGVLRRLVEEPDALARVARAALEICHFGSDGADQPDQAGECARACYRCLLSYSNQPDHALLDRRLVRDLLLELAAASTTVRESAASGGDAAVPDDLPTPLARVITAIRAAGGRDPQVVAESSPPYLLYHPSYCLLCPAPGEDVGDLRDELEDRGNHVIVLDPDGDVATHLASYSFWR